jgi:hypothetical protein
VKRTQASEQDWEGSGDPNILWRNINGKMALGYLINVTLFAVKIDKNGLTAASLNSALNNPVI